LLKLEPSAHIPWQKTMLGLVVLISNVPFLVSSLFLPAFDFRARLPLGFCAIHALM
jgi:hypothetical protein